MSEGSLWGDLSEIKPLRTPKTLLVEQADILTKETKGFLRGVVETSQNGNRLSHDLKIIAPMLNDYSYSVCQISHGINLYPSKLYDQTTIPPRALDGRDEDDLKQKLASVLGSEKMRRVIQSLLSQSRS